jgi:hypothetical protein
MKNINTNNTNTNTNNNNNELTSNNNNTNYNTINYNNNNSISNLKKINEIKFPCICDKKIEGTISIIDRVLYWFSLDRTKKYKINFDEITKIEKERQEEKDIEFLKIAYRNIDGDNSKLFKFKEGKKKLTKKIIFKLIKN